MNIEDEELERRLYYKLRELMRRADLQLDTVSREHTWKGVDALSQKVRIRDVVGDGIPLKENALRQ